MNDDDNTNDPTPPIKPQSNGTPPVQPPGSAPQTPGPMPQINPTPPVQAPLGGKVPGKSKKKLIIIIISIVVLVAIVGVYLYLSQNNNENTSDTTSQETEVKPDVTEISLNAVKPYTGTATATRSYSGGKFTHTVTATIADPASGKFYEGWLVIKKPELKFFSTGRMTKQANGTYTLSYTSDTDQSAYNSVIITDETEANGLDGKPEAHVFDASF